ncbi:MAG: hypothetical protein H7834_14510 [Magnetococcus sp. YQC-9]
MSDSHACVELQIETIVPGGMGLARLNGQVVFVEGVIPGDRILARIVATHRHHLAARREQLLEPGPGSVDPVCPHADRCGGCQLRRLDPARQDALKTGFVRESLQRIARIDPGQRLQPLLSAHKRDGYRRRARIQTHWTGDRFKLGFFAHASHDIVEIDHCPALDPRLSALFPALRRLGATLHARDALTACEMIAGDHAIGLIIALSHPCPTADKESMRALARESGIGQLGLRIGKAPPASLLDTTPLTYRVAGHTIGFASGDFVQGHAEQNERLVAVALEMAGSGSIAWDLFCGVGNFTLPLAERFERVVAADLYPGSLRRVMENGRQAGVPGISTQRADLFRTEGVATLPWQKMPADKILIDPPRNGAECVCRQLAVTKTARLVYISCDPATFARDAALLIAGGYTLEQVQPVDLFPQTRHVELVASFQCDAAE